MSGVDKFVDQEEFDEVLRAVKYERKDEPEDLYQPLVADYDHDVVYIDRVGEGVEMLCYRLSGYDHYNYYYVKPKWYAFKVAREKLMRLLSLGR